MQQLNSQTPATDAPPAPRTEVGVMPLFSTWVYLCRDGLIDLSDRLEELTGRLRQDNRNAVRRTNTGGWHYAFDLFELKDPVVAEFHDQMEQHVQAYLNHLHRLLTHPILERA